VLDLGGAFSLVSARFIALRASANEAQIFGFKFI
jgi:hypothetical protein